MRNRSTSTRREPAGRDSFPLTPALSLGERAKQVAPLADLDARSTGAARPLLFPLPEGEGQGEGNGAPSLLFEPLPGTAHRQH
jgi:hypothetical protein